MKFKDCAVVDENENVEWIVLDPEKVKAIRLIIRDELAHRIYDKNQYGHLTNHQLMMVIHSFLEVAEVEE